MPKLILNGNTLGVNIDEFKGATSSAAGTNGVVPKPLSGEQEHFLKADGTWSNTFGETRVCTTSDPICRDADDSYMIFRACTKSQPNGGAILLGGQGNATYPGVFSIFARDHGGTSGAARSVALLGKPDGTLTWGGQDVMRRNTTFTGATSSAAGKAGVVPAPAAGANTKFLRGDGTWQPALESATIAWNLTNSNFTVNSYTAYKLSDTQYLTHLVLKATIALPTSKTTISMGVTVNGKLLNGYSAMSGSESSKSLPVNVYNAPGSNFFYINGVTTNSSTSYYIVLDGILCTS